MNKSSRIYVAGHTGFIGSAVTKKLKESGYKNLVLRTHKELDLTRQKEAERLFKKERPEYVFLLAAKVGGIRANSAYPADFIYQNLAIQTNVMHAAYKYKAKKLLFLGSACMYPKVCPQPMRPEHLLTGAIEPTSEPFAIAKIAGFNLCRSYNRQLKTNFICAIPATVYGPGDHFDENGHVVAGLIMRFHQAASGKKKKVEIWGTGKPKRELIFIDDAAAACIFLMDHHNGSGLINIGGRGELSVRSLAEKIKDEFNFGGRIEFIKSKPDGVLRRMLDSKETHRLGWRPKVAFDNGLKITCNWYKSING